jgi:hypothetical protein
MDWTWVPPTSVAIVGFGVLLKVHAVTHAGAKKDWDRIEKKVDHLNGSVRDHGEDIAAMQAICSAHHPETQFLRRHPKPRRT